MPEEPSDPPVHTGVAIPEPARRRYTRPALVEYGNVAKLTQSGGSSAMEGPTPFSAMQMAMGMGMCL